MPHVLALTDKSALVQCEYLVPPQGVRFRSQVEYDAYKERVKAEICDKKCGIQRDASLRNPPIQLVCIYVFLKELGDPKQFLATLEQKTHHNI